MTDLQIVYNHSHYHIIVYTLDANNTLYLSL